jgi:hypothetical protein
VTEFSTSALLLRIGDETGSQQVPSVRMLGVPDHSVCGAEFDDLSLIHDPDTVGNMVHYREVVRDE